MDMDHNSVVFNFFFLLPLGVSGGNFSLKGIFYGNLTYQTVKKKLLWLKKGAPCTPGSSSFLSVCAVASVASDSVLSYGPQPARLHCPWDAPGKKTGAVAMPSSRGSFRPRDQTGISFNCCTGRCVLYHQHHLGCLFFLFMHPYGAPGVPESSA